VRIFHEPSGTVHISDRQETCVATEKKRTKEFLMGFKHRIDHDNGAMYATADGLITLSDIREHLFKERRENGLTYAELIDARTASPDFSSRDVREIASLLTVFAKEHVLGPTAVVVSTDVGFRVVRIIENLVESICAVRPFLDVDAALEWLRKTRLASALSGRSAGVAVEVPGAGDNR
jgi:hypothetical protein